MNASRRTPIEYNWQPVSGAAVSVQLHPSLEAPDRFFAVYRQDEHLGDVFRDEHGFWRFRRVWVGNDEMLGSQLRNARNAASALLFSLRQSGKI